MITVEGLKITTEIEALSQGNGFTTHVEAEWNIDRNDGHQQAALQQAKKDGLIGRLLNGHESAYGAAETAVSDRVNAWETEITTFISDYNASIQS